MGIFSSKKKTYVGISNSRLYEGDEIPNSIKDSTAGYISDIGKGLTDGNYLTDYNKLAMESSLERGIRKATNFVRNRDSNNYNKFSATQKSVKEPENLDDKIRGILFTNLSKYYSNPVINYCSYEYLDMSHIVKLILDIEYGWNSYNNTLLYNGFSGWLYSVDIHLTSVQDEPRLGNSFASGETATRDKDPSKPYRPFLYEENGLATKRNKVVFKFMPKYVKSFVRVTREFRDKTTQDILDTTTEIRDINDNQPIEESSTLYYTLNTFISSETLEDPDDPNIEIEETKREISESSYGTLKQKTLYLENYIDTVPDDLPEIDGESLSPTSQKVLDYINQIESNYNENTSDFNDLIVSVSVRTDANTNKHFSFGNMDINAEGLEGDMAKALNNMLDIDVLTGYVPDIHLKKNNVVASPNDSDWRINNLYAKKLSIKLDGLYEQLTESMKNDEDKIRHAYITFGVNVHSNTLEDISYLYYFFINELKGKTFSDSKEIILSTKTTSESIKWENITKTIVETPITKDFENSSNGSTLIILRKLNDISHERITVNNYKRTCRVTGGNQTGVLSNLFSGKWGSTGEDSTELLPLNLEILKKSIKSFVKRERFIYRCMYVEFLTYVVVKTKWYKRGVFKLVTIVVGAAIVFATGGAGSYLSALLISSATAFAIDFAVKLTVKTLGVKWAKIIAYGLAIVGLGKGIGGAMIATGQNITKVLGAFLSNAKLFVSIANKMLNQSIQTVGVERQEEMDENNRELARLKEMTENLLGSRVNEVEYQTDRNYMSSYIYLGTMESYLDEILDLNKIDSCIEYIHNYSEYLISLPTLDESVGSILGVK